MINSIATIPEVISGLIGVLAGSLLSWLTSYYFYRKTDAHERIKLLTVLTAELKSIQRHDEVSIREIPEFAKGRNEIIGLSLGKYGNLVFSGSDLSRIGFLTRKNIEDVIRLGLAIRNCDSIIEHVYNNVLPPRADEHPRGGYSLTGIRDRMKKIVGASDTLLQEIGERTKLV